MNYKFLFPWKRPNDCAFFNNLDNLRELHDTTIVYFHPEEHSKIIEDPVLLLKIQKILKRNNCILELWLGNFEDNDSRLEKLGINKKLIDIVNWPMFLMNQSYFSFKKRPLLLSESSPIKYLFLCLNRRQGYHKCMMIDEIFKRKLQKRAKISWLERGQYSIDYDFKHFNKTLLILDTTYQFDIFNKNREKLYSDCLIDLVVETSVDIKDISEKTWFGILHKRPTLILGHTGIHQNLKNLGFELYDELFDYAFDIEQDLFTKIQLILNNLEKHKTQDYNDVYSQLTTKLNNNVAVMENIVHDVSNIPEKFFYYVDHFQHEYPLLTYYYNIGVIKK